MLHIPQVVLPSSAITHLTSTHKHPSTIKSWHRLCMATRYYKIKTLYKLNKDTGHQPELLRYWSLTASVNKSMPHPSCLPVYTERMRTVADFPLLRSTLWRN